MSLGAKGHNVATRLSEAPLVHPSAVVKDSALGRYVEICECCVVAETHVGDYSYLMQDCETWAARIGKFVNVASYARVNAPTTRPGARRCIISPIAPMIIGPTRRAKRASSTGGARTR